MKLEFFKRAVELVEKYRRPEQGVQQTFQTNGLLMDDDWCAVFKANKSLVGLSVDGPRDLHDTYRRDRRGQGTFDLAMRGRRYLRDHGVDFNIVCTVTCLIDMTIAATVYGHPEKPHQPPRKANPARDFSESFGELTEIMQAILPSQD